MKITIVGPGAMGCLFAALLSRSKAKHDIWLLDKSADRAKKIESAGVTVEGLSSFTQAVKTTHDAKKIGPCDLVIIFTKSYDTDKALDSIKPLLGTTTHIMTLQNGLGNMELISEQVGEDRTIGGMTSLGAMITGPGKVRWTGKGETVIGKPSGRIFGDMRQISALFNEAGIETRLSKDIDGVVWSKLIINSGINALGAILKVPNGLLVENEGTRELMRQAVSEATKVARRKRAKLLYDDTLQKTESVCGATAKNCCSMLQDIMQNKKTEIDQINGAIVRQGKACGVKTPVNEMLTQLVKALESGYGDQAKTCS